MRSEFFGRQGVDQAVARVRGRTEDRSDDALSLFNMLAPASGVAPAPGINSGSSHLLQRAVGFMPSKYDNRTRMDNDLLASDAGKNDFNWLMMSPAATPLGSDGAGFEIQGHAVSKLGYNLHERGGDHDQTAQRHGHVHPQVYATASRGTKLSNHSTNIRSYASAQLAMESQNITNRVKSASSTSTPKIAAAAGVPGVGGNRSKIDVASTSLNFKSLEARSHTPTSRRTNTTFTGNANIGSSGASSRTSSRASSPLKSRSGAASSTASTGSSVPNRVRTSSSSRANRTFNMSEGLDMIQDKTPACLRTTVSERSISNSNGSRVNTQSVCSDEPGSAKTGHSRSTSRSSSRSRANNSNPTTPRTASSKPTNSSSTIQTAAVLGSKMLDKVIQSRRSAAAGRNTTSSSVSSTTSTPTFRNSAPLEVPPTRQALIPTQESTRQPQAPSQKPASTKSAPVASKEISNARLQSASARNPEKASSLTQVHLIPKDLKSANTSNRASVSANSSSVSSDGADSLLTMSTEHRKTKEHNFSRDGPLGLASPGPAMDLFSRPFLPSSKTDRNYSYMGSYMGGIAANDSNLTINNNWCVDSFDSALYRDDRSVEMMHLFQRGIENFAGMDSPLVCQHGATSKCERCHMSSTAVAEAHHRRLLRSSHIQSSSKSGNLGDNVQYTLPYSPVRELWKGSPF